MLSPPVPEASVRCSKLICHRHTGEIHPRMVTIITIFVLIFIIVAIIVTIIVTTIVMMVIAVMIITRKRRATPNQYLSS